MKLFLKLIALYIIIFVILLINRIKPYEVKKVEDIRICGDCGNAIKNPKDKIAPKWLLHCRVTNSPIHRAKSVNWCFAYKIRGSHETKEKEQEE